LACLLSVLSPAIPSIWMNMSTAICHTPLFGEALVSTGMRERVPRRVTGRRA
jgi:hypothetical protein